LSSVSISLCSLALVWCLLLEASRIIFILQQEYQTCKFSLLPALHANVYIQVKLWLCIKFVFSTFKLVSWMSFSLNNISFKLISIKNCYPYPCLQKISFPTSADHWSRYYTGHCTFGTGFFIGANVELNFRISLL